jgi:hypothetical protein
MYFCTYQSHLLYPAILGWVLAIYQYFKLYKTGNQERSIDTLWNCLYSIFLCIWSSVFVENWKKIEEKLIF